MVLNSSVRVLLFSMFLTGFLPTLQTHSVFACGAAQIKIKDMEESNPAIRSALTAMDSAENVSGVLTALKNFWRLA